MSRVTYSMINSALKIFIQVHLFIMTVPPPSFPLSISSLPLSPYFALSLFIINLQILNLAWGYSWAIAALKITTK